MPDKSAAGPRLTKLGRYEVLNELGKGAMGIVYLAKDPVIGRMVAIKTIRTSNFGDDDSESREFRERFIREAQTAGILSHPNIVTIHDIGEDPDTQVSFIAMEYIEGRNLKSLLGEKTKFTYEQIADIIAQVAEAIDYAHRKGIIHRDIKPANVIITTDNKVKIMDFGIAKIASSNLTTTGQFLGTPNYMSPEQVSGAAVDGRSDIFSLGVVLYELLTSRKPFQGENLTAISYKIVHEEFTPPAELAPDVPSDFNAIVARAMAKDPWNRYQRGKDFALALHQLRARMEEQRAFRDLGSMVSAAENMPTLRLENLEKVAAEAQAAHASARPAEIDHSDMTEDSGSGSLPFGPPPARSTPAPGKAGTGSGRKAEARTMAIPVVTGDLPPPPPEEDEHRATAPEVGASTSPGLGPRPTPPPAPPPTPPPAVPGVPAPGGAFPPTQPLAPAAKTALRPAWAIRLDALRESIAGGEWKRTLRAEVNRPWFWGLTAAAALFLVVILGAGLLRIALVSRPSVSADPEVARDVAERKQALATGKKLFAEGKYDQSLQLLRQVLARSPGNQEARRFAQMAESAMAGRAEEARKSAEAEKSLEAARTALAANQYAEAVQHADEALALDGGKVEAQKIKDDAQAKLAETKAAEAKAAEAQARKKRDDRKTQLAARKQPTAAPQGRGEKPTAAPSTAAAASAAAGPATLKLQFQSPISEGSVMVYVNDQKALQKPFDFSRKAGLFKRVEGTGTVEEAISVHPGPVSVKIWLSGRGLTAAAYTTASGQLGGGETRVLKVDYAGGQLSARIQ